VTTAQSHSYVALLKARDRLPELLRLLPVERRSEIETVLKDLGGLDQAELRRRYRKARELETQKALEDAVLRAGMAVKNFPARLQGWILQFIERDDY
jgi:hypothetical protein